MIPETEFQTKVLGGVEALQSQQQKMLGDFDRLDKETKKAFEELTVAKNQVRDVGQVVVALQKVQGQLIKEQRNAFASPLQRILGDEDKRARINAMVRLAVDNHGDMVRVAAPILKALGEDSSPGSTLITTALAKELYDTLAMHGKWGTLGVRNLGTKVTTYPVKTARPVANFILTESDTISDDTNKAGTSVELTAKVIAALLNVSLQLLQDAEFDVASDVLDDFIEAYNLRLDHAAFVGDGVADATNGGMTGVFNFGTNAVAGAGNTTVAALDLEDFVRCLTTVAVAVLSRGPKWWMHPQMLARTILVRDANGRSIFLTGLEAPSLGGIGSILGYPVELVNVAPSTDAAASKVAAFGDRNGMVVGVRTDFAFEASDHHKWNTLQRSYRAYGRAGVKGRRADAFAILKTAAA